MNFVNLIVNLSFANLIVVNLNFAYLNSFLVILDFVIIIVNFIYSEGTIAKAVYTIDTVNTKNDDNDIPTLEGTIAKGVYTIDAETTKNDDNDIPTKNQITEDMSDETLMNMSDETMMNIINFKA